MKRIAYLLHRFPAITDTFIKREIRSLQAAGTSVLVISVWKPKDTETTPVIMSEWAADTRFILPRSAASILYTLCSVSLRSPRHFLTALRLALTTSRPGVRGIAYQLS
jgi:colanic acid/amylovoran biosynthesis glycosyltransferase